MAQDHQSRLAGQAQSGHERSLRNEPHAENSPDWPDHALLAMKKKPIRSFTEAMDACHFLDEDGKTRLCGADLDPVVLSPIVPQPESFRDADGWEELKRDV